MHNHLNLSADTLLTTTRAVRKRLDFAKPVPIAVIEECLAIALQAPTGSNSQGWHFVIVNDSDKIASIAGYYLQSFAAYEASPVQPTRLHTDDPAMQHTQQKVLSSARYLAENMHRLPALLIPCFEGRLDQGGVSHQQMASIYGSILPATWSFMLAARERGIGTCWTTLHLAFEQQIAELLGIPAGMSQAALIPMAYTIGTDFAPAPRKPLPGVVHTNRW